MASDRDQLRQRLIGLGERSIKKSYYPELQRRMTELERFRQVLDQASDAIFVADAHTGRIADANATAARLTGWPKEHLLARRLGELFDPFPDSAGAPFLSRLQRRDDPPVEVEVSPWEHAFAGARYRVCMVRDVTQRLRAQAERELLIGELERKNLELERFLYTASHDLKTPLTTIKGFTGLLAEDFSHDDREAVSKDLARIDDAVDHMIALLNDLLHLSRIGSLEASRERVCLAELAATVLEDLAAARPGLQGRVRISPDLPCAEGNRALLAEVFAKLIDNAVKFSPPRGEGGPSWPDIEIAATTGDGNEPAVCVRDRGEGVDERYRENIFGLFNQLDPRVPGTGVGLTIVRRIVELHGGRIWVRSRTDGPGAAFCFTLRGCEEAPA